LPGLGIYVEAVDEFGDLVGERPFVVKVGFDAAYVQFDRVDLQENRCQLVFR
jgi:hypothetical protein